jgi:FtsH-binding integral membrane protein
MSNWNQQPGWNQQQAPASWSNPQGYQQPGYGYAPRTMDAGVDAGLRSFMLGVYNYMAVGLLISAAIAYFVATASVTGDASQGVARIGRNGPMLTQLGYFLYVSPFKWVIILAPIAMIFGYSFLQERMSAGATRVFYFAFTAIMGLSLATVFFVYRIGSIGQVFLMTAAAFGAMSLWGYTTKRDLTGMGTFLIMGLVGLMIASIVNLFLASSALQFAISVIGVLVFAGLTAWDTQRLKESYYDHMDAGELTKAAVDGAFSLYLNFVNMFQLLLSLFGQRD